uniref:Uncharacterized protein MANES_18G007700 n=1 Tax=Rhizophora mucronata TaxID=61149 RepID=A0A2P2KUX7_RHIMU
MQANKTENIMQRSIGRKWLIYFNILLSMQEKTRIILQPREIQTFLKHCLWKQGSKCRQDLDKILPLFMIDIFKLLIGIQDIPTTSSNT